MKDARIYFKHDSPAYNDLKLRALRRRFNWEGYGKWWYIIELLRMESDYKLDYSDMVFDALADDMGGDVKPFIDYCIEIGLLETDGKQFWSPRLLKDMMKLEGIRTSCSEASKSRWNADAMPTHSKCNAKVSKDTISKVKSWDEAAGLIRGNYPLMDDTQWNNELNKCREYYTDIGKVVKSYRATLRNWIDKSYKNIPVRKDKWNEDWLAQRSTNNGTNQGNSPVGGNPKDRLRSTTQQTGSQKSTV